MKKEEKFTWVDSWLLYSIYKTSNKQINLKQNLREIIMMGDAINHAIFNLIELNEGISKYISLELIKEESDYCFIFTNNANDIFEKLNRSKIKNTLKLIDFLKETINKVKIEDFIIRDYINEEEYNNAFEQYKKYLKDMV